MKKALVALILTTAATSANAGIVYLDCEFSENRLFKVTLNEATSTVIQDFGTGLIRTYRAIFKADTVQYIDSPGKIEESIFTINRSSLAFSRYLPNIKATDQGACKINKPNKNNKF